MYKLEAFKILDDMFETHDNLFLNKQINYYKKFQPLKGLKVLQNIPLTNETLKKVESLAFSGAELTITALSFVKPVDHAVKVLQNSGINVIIDHSKVPDDFDIILDCSGEFRSRLKPRIGSVELTRTGVNLYNESDASFPIIDIDSTRTKEIETVLGTGDGFLRAFQELTQLKNFKDLNFVIFGYGKVGQGITRKIHQFDGNVTIVEISNENIDLAKSHNLKVINGVSKDEVHKAVKSSYAVVTATGINNVISTQYDPNVFIGKVLANMGGGDEFGDQIPAVACLSEKAPINFSSDKPTLMKYIDPIFFLHNHCAEILSRYKPTKGVHVLDKHMDYLISNEWELFHKEKI